MMQQAQKMQKQIQEKLDAFEKKAFAFNYKNNSVVVTIMGNFKILKIDINPVLVDPDDKQTLQEMVTEAINSAYNGIKQQRDKIQDSVVQR